MRSNLGAFMFVLFVLSVSCINQCLGEEGDGNSPPLQPVSPATVGQTFVIAKGPVPEEMLTFGSNRVAFSGRNYLAVWDMWKGNERGVYAARFSPRGGRIDTTAITTAMWKRANLPNVAFDGLNYFVVWNQWRGNKQCTCGSRVALDGTVLDTAGVVISESSLGSSWTPAVAFDGRNYLVVWNELGRIGAARVSSGGGVLDKGGIAISRQENSSSPSVVYGDDQYLVVWDVLSGQGPDVESRGYFARVDTFGTVLDVPAKSISSQAGFQAPPSVSFDGDEYFVVWQQFAPSGWRIAGTRIDRNGQVIDPEGIVVSTPSNEPQQNPSVAFGGGCYLAVWQQNKEIYAMRIGRDGSILDSDVIPIRTRPRYERTHEYPAVVAGDRGFLVMWQETYGLASGGKKHFICGAHVAR